MIGYEICRNEYLSRLREIKIGYSCPENKIYKFYLINKINNIKHK